MEARIVLLSTLVVWSSWTFSPPPVLGESACVPADTELPEAVIMAVRAVDLDLVVTLRWHPDTDPSVSRELVLRDRNDVAVAALPVVPATSGFPEVVLVNALGGVGGSGFQFFLRVESATHRGSDALPFFLLRRCPATQGGLCHWEALVGFHGGDAVVLSEELDKALAAQPGCDLHQQLAAVEAAYPYLKEETEQFQQQMGTPLRKIAAESECSYFWQAVVYTSNPTLSTFYQELSLDGGMTDAELMGFAQDAGHCQAAQARRLSSGVTHPSTVSNFGVVGLGLSVRCSAGPPRCRKTCGGETTLALDYDSCAVAEAVTDIPFGSGMGRGREEVYLMVDGTLSHQDTVEALSMGEPVQDSDSFLHTATAGLPLYTFLWTLREVEVSASYATLIGGAEPAPLTGAGFAFTEVSNEYTLTVAGLAGPGCPLDTPGVAVQLESPDYMTATALQRGGSIKIEKW
jgi:hypothetical protein